MFGKSPLPLIPGIFLNTVTPRNFHCPHHFEYNDGVCRLTDKTNYEEVKETKCCPNYDSSCQLPSWVLYDRHTLTFDAFFEEPALDTYKCKEIIRKVKIFYFLEDGTLKVVEPKILNSGIPQGCLIARQRIPYTETTNPRTFFDVSHLNVGKTVNLFGRKFTITDCDAFTRSFLIRYGIPVPESIPAPSDPYTDLRNEEKQASKSSVGVKQHKVKQFLEYDRKVLSFRGFWDDRQSENGSVHLLHLLYYLADNTMEIFEILPEFNNRRKCFLQRSKIPKKGHDLNQIGSDLNLTVLNVLGANIQKSRFLYDVLNCGGESTEYYNETDLGIGKEIAVYGRSVTLCDCDEFTKSYYKFKYGLEDLDFTPVEFPPYEVRVVKKRKRDVKFQLPPYNGFGSLEDSALNCALKCEIMPSPSSKASARDQSSTRFLKFSARILSDNRTDEIRQFTITYYLDTHLVDIFENPSENSGFCGGMFYSGRKIIKPNQEILTTKAPDYYDSDDFYIGNTIVADGFKFFLTGADKNSLKYMEEHSNNFPFSNFSSILEKVKSVFKHTFRNFLEKYYTNSPDKCMSFQQFRTAVKEYMGNQLTEHEILTLARHYKRRPRIDKLGSLTKIKILVHNDLRRFMFDDSDRLLEQFKHRDPGKTGRVSKDTAYTALRGAQTPLSQELILIMLGSLSAADNSINYQELLQFMDYKNKPMETSNAKESVISLKELIAEMINTDENSTTISLEQFIADLNLDQFFDDN